MTTTPRPVDGPRRRVSSPRRMYRGLTLAERRSDQHERLVRAAIQCFGTQGFARTTVEDIVRTARTSRAAFYEFFENRDACLVAAYQDAISQIGAAVAPALAAAPPDRFVEEGIRAFVGLFVRDPALARVVFVDAPGAAPDLEEARREMRAGGVEVLMAAWADTDPEAASGPVAEAICSCVFGAFVESIAHLVETGRIEQAPELVPALTRLVYRAFSVRSDLGRPGVAAAAS